LLDQDFLRNKSELERKMYFTELFSVDTTALDTELFNVQRDATTLRAKIGGYGEIDLKPVETVDTSALKAELAKVRQDYETAKTELERELQKMSNDHEIECAVVDERNDKIRAHNQAVDNIVSKKETIVRQIAQTEFSPPAWGWSVWPSRPCRPGGVLPTRVGMVRWVAEDRAKRTFRQPQSRHQSSLRGQTIRNSPPPGIVRAPEPDAIRGGSPDGNGFGGGFAPGRIYGHGRALTRPRRHQLRFELFL
jgi:hypothetical protein